MSKIIGIDLGTTFSAIAQLDDLETLRFWLQQTQIKKLLQVLYI